MRNYSNRKFVVSSFLKSILKELNKGSICTPSYKYAKFGKKKLIQASYMVSYMVPVNIILQIRFSRFSNIEC